VQQRQRGRVLEGADEQAVGYLVHDEPPSRRLRAR
jgi:hypothetical protein